MTNINSDRIQLLVAKLLEQPKETEWLEFKHNNDKPEDIGEYISALANSAATHQRPRAYMIWGIDDKSRSILGTHFTPLSCKVGNEELQNWLLRSLDPKVNFQFFEINIGEKSIVLLEIYSATHYPIQFKGEKFIRVGSYKKKLKDHPEKERDLWRLFEKTPFELQVAQENVSPENVLKALDYPAYFDLVHLPLPESRDHILASLKESGLITLSDFGLWNILNLGAILFAKNLLDFDSLKRKPTRVIFYEGNDKQNSIREHIATKGYASGFKELIDFINNFLPANEVLGVALRKNIPMYPERSIREIIANALIHQDFFISGSGPTVEIFKDRIEITNPGKPLIDVLRFVDHPPRSRNEKLALFMKRIGICEERGSGIDSVILDAEFYKLPAPLFEVYDNHLRVVLFSSQKLSKMDKNDRIRACYQHACLQYVTRDYMTNTSLRQRFEIEAKNSSIASRILKETLEANLICSYSEEASGRYAKYVPFWVKAHQHSI